jgi:hypothetical protein
MKRRETSVSSRLSSCVAEVVAMIASRAARVAALLSVAMLAQPCAARADAITVNYTIAVAGLPIGSAVMALAPNGSSTAVNVSGRIGGALDLGRFAASGTVAPGHVTARSTSGSGKDATAADLVSRGSGGARQFSYRGETPRGPGAIAMTVAGGNATQVEAKIPDNPQAVRVPVTEAHRQGVVDPLVIVERFFRPGGTIDPAGVCGRRQGVFTGQVRFDMAGTGLEPAAPPSGAPAGWSAVSCKVTTTPISGHRIDKGNRPQTRTATLVFVQAPDKGRSLLWSLAVPSGFGSFSLTANSVK